jgi:hypothetical protein
VNYVREADDRHLTEGYIPDLDETASRSERLAQPVGSAGTQILSNFLGDLSVPLENAAQHV